MLSRQAKDRTNLHHTRGITPKCETSGAAYLRGLTPGNTAPKKHRNSGEPLADLTGPGIEPQTFRNNNDVVTVIATPTGRLPAKDI